MADRISQNLPHVQSRLFKEVLTASALVSVTLGLADTQLVQWTSYAVTPTLLAFEFAVTTALVFVLAMFLGSTRVMVLGTIRKHGAGSVQIYAALVCFVLICYILARLRMTGVLAPGLFRSMLGLAAIAAIVIPLPSWNQWRSQFVMLSLLGLYLSLVGVIVVHRSQTTLGVEAVGQLSQFPVGRPIALLSLALLLSALLLWLIRWASRSRLLGSGPMAGSSVFTFCLVLGLNLFLMGVTYPAVPGQGGRVIQSTANRGAVRDIGPPNIILLVLDTVGADHMSLYGYPLATTPNLEAFSGQATTFTQAYANATWSLPSHASILTGHLPHRHGAHFAITGVTRDPQQPDRSQLQISASPLSGDFTTIPEYLQPEGYRTAVISANHAWFDVAHGLVQGFEQIDSRAANVVSLEFLGGPFLRKLHATSPLRARYDWLANSTHRAPAIIGRVGRWLDEGGPAPFFLMMNFMDVHDVNGISYAVRNLPGVTADFPAVAGDLSGQQRYDLALRYLDHHLGAFFGELRDRGLFDESLIIITSDHGEAFLSDGSNQHGMPPWQSQVHVPLVIKRPNQQTAEVVHSLAQGIDILPTLLDAVGVAVPEELRGSPVGSGAAAAVVAEAYFSLPEPEDPITSENVDEVRPTAWALIEDSWKLIRFSNGQRLLYDLASDPDELANLADLDPARLGRMEERLNLLVPPDVFSSYLAPTTGVPLDNEMLQRLRSLGYVR